MFIYWLEKAKRGERVVYYDGFLMRDREQAVKAGFFSDQFPAKLKSAIAAWKAYTSGLVILTQKKRGFAEYEYIAIKV
jgi:hypothetical protein